MSNAPEDYGPDDWFPLDEEDHHAQLSALHELLAPMGAARVLDVGCGTGRIAVPLAESGHSVVAVDRDAHALAHITPHPRIRTIALDVHAAAAARQPLGEPFDLAVCLGHTFMTFAAIDQAIELMTWLHRQMKPGAPLAIDAFCNDIWRDVAEGNWQEGISQDGQWQLIWGVGDDLVVLRRGTAVDPDSWEIQLGDRPLRLWSLGSLELLARLAGWRGPLSDDTGHLLVFRA